MDIRVNLLPPEILGQQKQKRKQLMMLLAGGLVLVFLVGLFGVLFTVTAMTNAEAARLQERREILEQQAKAYRPYEEMSERIARTEKLIKQAVGSAPNWAGVITEIGISIPPTVWLSELSATYKADENTGELVLKGRALDHSSVAAWLEEIHGISGISNVLCQFSTQEGSGDSLVIRFEIKATLDSGLESEPGSEKAGN